MSKKKIMLFKIPLLSLAIWLLFLISPLFHSLSHALPQDNTVEVQLPPAGVEFPESSLEEETLVRFDVIGLRKMGMNNGRSKRVAMKRPIMRKLETTTTTNDERKDEDQESSRISGLKKESSNKSVRVSQANSQENIKARTSSKNSQHVKAKSISSKRPLSTRDKEIQKLLKAAKEIANLMHKDYKDWGHHKPPINNDEPMH